MYSQYLLHYLLPVLSNLPYDKCVITCSTCHDRLPSFDIIPWIYENIMREIERYNKGFIHSYFFFSSYFFFRWKKDFNYVFTHLSSSFLHSAQTTQRWNWIYIFHSVNNLLPGIIRRIAQSFYVFWINLDTKIFLYFWSTRKAFLFLQFLNHTASRGVFRGFYKMLMWKAQTSFEENRL